MMNPIAENSDNPVISVSELNNQTPEVNAVVQQPPKKLNFWTKLNHNQRVYMFSLLAFALIIPVSYMAAIGTINIWPRAVEPVTPPSLTLSIDVTPTPPLSSRRVFVTSTTYSGNLGGLVGADAKCQARAIAANLDGTWKAWLSDSKVSASSRLYHSSVPYRLLNGTIVANNWADLTDGSIQNGIAFDEFGKSWYSYLAWTATKIDGNLVDPWSWGTVDGVKQYWYFHCFDWTSTTDKEEGKFGIIGYTDNQWTDANNYKSCNVSFMHLYCFEETNSTYLPTPTPTLKPTPINMQNFSLSLTPPGSFTPNAAGNVKGQVIKNTNEYWNFTLTGSFSNLMPNRNYQLWLCSSNSVAGCSSHTSAQFTTDSTGAGSIATSNINYPQGRYPIQRVSVWQSIPTGGLPQDASACFNIEYGIYGFPCLRGNLSFTATPTPTPILTSTPAPAPKPVMITPKGGEVWQRGKTYQISWNETVKAASTSLFLYTRGVKGDTYLGAIAYNVSNLVGKNTYSWTIPMKGSSSTTPPDGNNIIISVTQFNSSGKRIAEAKSNPFTVITSPTPTPTPIARPTPTIDLCLPNACMRVVCPDSTSCQCGKCVPLGRPLE